MAAIRFERVFKWFSRHAGRMLLRDRVLGLLRGGSHEPFLALQDITFTIEHGESVAIVGHNGAGKSTLLNLATHLAEPSAGKIHVNGRVAALLELGSGFHPDLTGAENLRINAALLGLSRQRTRERFDQIVEFSGIGDFINEPLRTYSSGMIMRLAFSVAINVDPDILVIDEMLGVGDQAFAVKCMEKLLEFRQAGKTLLCVSHSPEMVKSLCERALWLDHGKMVRDGSAAEILKAYGNTAVPQPLQAAV